VRAPEGNQRSPDSSRLCCAGAQIPLVPPVPAGTHTWVEESVRSAPPGTDARSAEAEPRLLAEGWLRFEAPFGRAGATAVGPRERPSLERLEEVVVVVVVVVVVLTEQRQVAGKRRTEPLPGPPPTASIGGGPRSRPAAGTARSNLVAPEVKVRCR
jgi:hypothetical protein